ncbi:hypothetical protein PUMCH_002815 [Australozyma saopauloensis]|uniref:Uncharacterized protein n=1 Tax=Australozyma saopauloensis TaxID=291208 RepID=A0AAX4HAC6_9ASCO|nr:hypothetical protein PUMCH_002815 [[Candida] saopauloensis]
MHAKPAVKGSRKRALEPAVLQKDDGFLSSAGDELLPPQSGENIVEEDKVKQFLARMKFDEDDAAACVKVVMCDSEIANFTVQTQELLAELFSVSISISDQKSLCVDRIVSVYGPMAGCVRCVIYIAFLLNSQINNVVKRDAFTLKLTNYRVDVLVEAEEPKLKRTLQKHPRSDWASFHNNPQLYLVALRGDFSLLKTALCTTYTNHAYAKYSSDDAVEFLSVIRTHDADFMHPQQPLGWNKEAIRALINRKS